MKATAMIRSAGMFRALLVTGLMYAQGVMAGPEFGDVEFSQVDVVEGVMMLQGAGGNVGVVADPRGALVVDDDYAALAAKLESAVAKAAPGGVHYLLNTHWHADHAGGNQRLGTAGATIIAHNNVRARLQTGGSIPAFNLDIAPAPAEALPVITYDQGISVYWGGKRLQVEHVQQAHTDGDSVVYIYQGDQLVAVQTGDLFFNGFYPFIDAASGGNAKGMVKSVARILERIEDDTPIIPGHGPLATRSDLQSYHDFMKVAVERIALLKEAGNSRQQVVDARPVEDFEKQWGDGFLSTDVWVGIVFDSL